MAILEIALNLQQYQNRILNQIGLSLQRMVRPPNDTWTMLEKVFLL
jgi:hypothetical protein